VGDPEAGDPDAPAHGRDDRELDELDSDVVPPVRPEGPEPVGDPRGDRGDDGRHDLGADRIGEEVLAQRARAQQVEDRHIDAVADQPDRAELEGVRDQPADVVEQARRHDGPRSFRSLIGC